MNINTVIQLSVFIITIGTLIWKLSNLNSKVCHMDTAIKAAHSRIDKSSEKFENTIEEFRAQISSLTQILAHIEEKLNILMERK